MLWTGPLLVSLNISVIRVFQFIQTTVNASNTNKSNSDYDLIIPSVNEVVPKQPLIYFLQCLLIALIPKQ